MSEVALATAPLTAPPVIRALLAKLAIPYTEVADLPGLNPARKVQAVLLEDAVGALMVLFPQNQLLDLNRLTELTGRRLIAVSPERVARMLGKHDLSLLPGLPPLTSSPCLYEGSLLNEPNLLVHSGEAGLLLEIASDDFKTMLTKASAAQFGEPLSNIRPNLDRPNDDREEITQAMQAFTARRIQQRLEATIEIPPLADTAQKIIKLRVDPNATIDDITGVVETDPSLAAQVVSWAASPYYASPGKIRSVEDAIVRVLGFDLVINLALGLALGKTLSLPKDHPHQATPYWHQSIYTAAVIEGLTRAMPRAQRPAPGSRPDLPGRSAAQLRLPAAGPRVPAALLADLPPPGGQPAPVPQLCRATLAGHQPRADRCLVDALLGHAGRIVHRPALPARPDLRRAIC